MNKPYREQKPSSQLEDRLPIATYDKALFRLVQMSFSHIYDEDALRVGVQLVADIFWETEKTVEKDLRRAIRQLGG